MKPAVLKATLEAVIDGRKVVFERSYRSDVLDGATADQVVDDLFAALEWSYEITPEPPRRKHEEAVVVVHGPFRPNVELIKSSIERYYGDTEPPPSQLAGDPTKEEAKDG